MARMTRPVSWIRAALKAFETLSGQVDLSCRPDHRGRRRQSRRCEAYARYGLGLVRDRSVVQGRCVPLGLRGATRRGNLGRACVPKEIDAGHQDAQTRNRPDKGPFEKTEGDVGMKGE